MIYNKLNILLEDRTASSWLDIRGNIINQLRSTLEKKFDYNVSKADDKKLIIYFGDDASYKPVSDVSILKYKPDGVLSFEYNNDSIIISTKVGFEGDYVDQASVNFEISDVENIEESTDEVVTKAITLMGNMKIV